MFVNIVLLCSYHNDSVSDIDAGTYSGVIHDCSNGSFCTNLTSLFFLIGTLASPMFPDNKTSLLVRNYEAYDANPFLYR